MNKLACNSISDGTLMQRLAAHKSPPDLAPYIRLQDAGLCVECNAVFNLKLHSQCPACSEPTVTHLTQFVQPVKCEARVLEFKPVPRVDPQFDRWKDIGHAGAE
jgi:hypothetical protein